MTPPDERPTETLHIRRAAQLRALRDPVRSRILQQLQVHGPAPVRDLAERLGRSPESLYYHVRALVRAGFLRAEGKRPSGRRHHVVYGPTHARMLIDQTQRSPAFFAALEDHYAARMRRTERDMVQSLAGDRRRPGDEPRRTGLFQLDVRLSERGLQRFRERAAELLEAIEAEEEEAGDLLGVTIAFCSLEPPQG